MALQVWDAAESARLALPFSVTEAVIWGVFLTLLFIIGFFIVKEPAKRTNDDREVILQRMACVAVACVIAPLLLYYMLGHRLVLSHFSVPFHVWLGLPFVGVLQALALPLLLTAILFAGPLLLCYFDQELVFQQNFSFQRDVVAVLTSPIGLRNIIVAPVAEEFMFRGCLVPLLFLAGIPRGVIVATCPLFFGIGTRGLNVVAVANVPETAHLHHVRDMYKKEKLRGKHEYISIGPILLRAGTCCVCQSACRRRRIVWSTARYSYHAVLR